MFFVAAFVTFHGVQESNITLMEGEGTNVSSAYHNWELSMWVEDGKKRDVVAFDSDHLLKGQELHFKKFGFKIFITDYYRNCEAYEDRDQQKAGTLLNISGIQSLKPNPLAKAPEENIPGLIFKLVGANQGDLDILLFGRESKPVPIVKGDQIYYLKLRLKRFPIPFDLKLKEFKMERHPNTEIARSYESLVEVISAGVSREVLISMNEPLRHKSYTMYQASYSIDSMGREYSTLAVVKNQGRWLPYIATFLTFIGLAVHFLMMAFQTKRSVRRKKK